MVNVQYGKLQNYEGYLKPQKIIVNSNIELAVYKNKDKTKKPIIALIRKDNYDIFEPFLLNLDTIKLINTKLKKLGYL